jgi:flagellar biosynthesis protein FliP
MISCVVKRSGGLFAVVIAFACLLMSSTFVYAQTSSTPVRDGEVDRSDLTNPIRLLEDATRTLPSLFGQDATSTDGGAGGDSSGGSLAEAEAEAADESGVTSSLSILIILTVLTVAPALLIMCTSFTRIVVVLALLRQAIGTQSLPPSQVIVGLSMFMTFLVMAPVFEKINEDVIQPLSAHEIGHNVAWARAKAPIKEFMFAQIDYAGNWEDLHMILDYRRIKNEAPDTRTEGDVDMLTLVPAFIISELKVAFLMGFRLYLPFLIVDMVISSVLISMGMLMLPPVLISLPFKLLLFVLVDGWRLVAGNLLNSFVVPPG